MKSGNLQQRRHGNTWRGIVVSDLHLFRDRSLGGLAAQEARVRACNADFIVLNGDIFDFRWSSHPGVAAAEEAAIAWLVAFAADVFPIPVFYVLGNHDGHSGFRRRLDQEVPGIPNLSWFSAFIRVGSALFLHGDLPLGNPHRTPLVRAEGRQPRQRGAMLRIWNTGLVYPLFGHLAPLIFPQSFATRRVARTLRRHGREFYGKLCDVCFGHIHYPFHDVALGKLRLHNSGAPLPGFRWKLITVSTSAGDWEGR